MTSIRRRLLVWLLTSVLLAGLVAAAVVFMQARRQVNELFDYQLRQLAVTLRDRDYLAGDLAQALRAGDELDFVIEVWTPGGELLYATHPGVVVPPPERTGFSDVASAQGPWRVFATWHRGALIVVAHHRYARESLAFMAALRTLAPFLLALPLMGWLIWRLVGQEMRVLRATARDIARRTPESLEPIEHTRAPEEVRPLVEALNGLMARLGSALDQQRQFVADAAHELRTPLTALRLQLQLAERARDAAERERAHAVLREGIARTSRVVEQLLALARADPGAPTPARERADLGAIVRGVVEAHQPRAAAKGVALSFELIPSDSAGQGLADVQGDAASLETLAENLVDNAVRYTTQGSVVARVRREPEAVVLEVQDTGPGIAPQERERVFDRFYRGEAASGEGSGLGLAIVRRIAERHGARVELLDAPAGGLLARVTLSPA